MDITTDEQRHIAKALDTLRQGNWREFENQLWFAFGDRWTHVHTMLTQHQHIVLKGRWKDEPVLTERGVVLLQRLQEQPQTAVG